MASVDKQICEIKRSDESVMPQIKKLSGKSFLRENVVIAETFLLSVHRNGMGATVVKNHHGSRFRRKLPFPTSADCGRVTGAV